MSTAAVTVTMTPADCEYYAGLLDAQLAVNVTRGKGEPSVRVQLVCDDERVFGEMRNLVVPARETIVRRPSKRDSCVALLTGGQARTALEFAARHCVVKRELAAAALAYLDASSPEASAAALAAVQALLPAATGGLPEDVTVDWVSGFFDVRGSIDAPDAPPPVAIDPVAIDDPPADDDPPPTDAEDAETAPKAKKKAATKKAAKPNRCAIVKLVLPKHEKSLIPLIQRVLGGKVKKSSPCRIVFEKSSLMGFLDSVGHLVRVKRAELASVA